MHALARRAQGPALSAVQKSRIAFGAEGRNSVYRERRNQDWVGVDPALKDRPRIYG